MKVVFDESAKRIGPNTGDLMPSLAKRFSDANRNLAANALATVGAVASAMGAPVGERRHGHGLVPEIVKQFGDSKASVRTAAAGALEAWRSDRRAGKGPLRGFVRGKRSARPPPRRASDLAAARGGSRDIRSCHETYMQHIHAHATCTCDMHIHTPIVY